MPTACALVLTRNRKEMVVECLDALLAQTHPLERVVVIDNASTDGTGERLRERGLLDRPDVEYVRLEANRGGAGGYAEGVRVGLEAGADWLWLMDDDAEPRRDALERLLASPPAEDPQTVALCTTVVQPDGEIELLHRGHVGRFMRALPSQEYAPGHYADLEFASFVGLLVRTSAGRAIGLPRAEFFIGVDDVDYVLRLREHGRVRLVPESRIVHKLGMGGGTPTRRSRFWNRLLGAAFTSSSWDGYWKNLYGIRNYVAIRRERGALTPLSFAGLTGAYVARSLLYDAQPLRRLPWIVRYARKGWAGDFTGHTPEEWRELTSAR